ncbi:Protein of unknown function [Pyronema omphalodes CBS 100304]|uniref:Uncharacterized protein n=1 Tax=Pyronema omphalodes (strain CBS 100304) TaxID=1076935 RepID=U4LF29_PYROM|nr:Protein of unknown function [Pyronema omphalodes CBS 100304]
MNKGSTTEARTASDKVHGTPITATRIAMCQVRDAAGTLSESLSSSIALSPRQARPVARSPLHKAPLHVRAAAFLFMHHQEETS